MGQTTVRLDSTLLKKPIGNDESGPELGRAVTKRRVKVQFAELALLAHHRTISAPRSEPASIPS